MPDGLDLDGAAARLGISREAVRKRLQRGTLKGRRVNGRWSVELPDDPDGRADDGRTRADGDQLTEVLRDELAFLRRELETRRESERELRIIIARLTEQLKALPVGASDAPERDEKPRDEPQDTGYVYRVPEPVRRPWWQWWRRGPW
jgi:hypothetical protein